jgi:DNA-binding MarR family transcriptional regulator
MRQHLKKFILLALNQADGLPFPESALAQAVKQLARPGQPTSADVADALRDCEADGFISGVTDELTHERTWTLTARGVHKARQLQ